VGWTFYNSSGQRLSTASAINITNLDIDGATDIGAAIVDADLFIIDDGAGGTNRKTEASRIKTYVAVPAQAVQSAIEAETNQDTYIPPDLMKHAPSACKQWVKITAAGAITTPSYNTASITDTGTGDRTVVIATDMSGTTYAIVAAMMIDGTDTDHVSTDTFAVGSHLLRTWNGGSLADRATGSAVFGDL
jgi:hypothetical protein